MASKPLPNEWAETVNIIRLKVPFLSDGLTFMPVIVSDRVPLAATDGKAILVNPEGVDKFAEEIQKSGKPWFSSPAAMRAFIVIHELLHPLMRDPQRELGRDHKNWNRAADYINNAMIVDLFRMPPFKFDDVKIRAFEQVIAAHFLYDPKYRNQTKEEVYAQLEKECKGEGEGEGGALEGDFGGGVPDSGVPQDIAEIIKEKLEHYMSENASKMQGLGSGSREATAAAQKPPITMKQILKKIRDVVPSYLWNYQKPGRHDTWMVGAGLDGRMPNPVPNPGDKVRQIVLAIDSSGSVGPREMAAALAMLKAAFRHSPNPVRVLSVNTQCFDKGLIANIDKLDMSESGGTHLACMIDKIKELKIKPSVVVLITDAFDDQSSIDRFKRWSLLPKLRTVVVGNPQHSFPGMCFPCDLIDPDIARKS